MPVGFILIVLAFLFIYLVLLRPQRRRQMEQQQMWQSLKEGDEVVTAGGLYGTITGFEHGDPVVEIAPTLEVRVARRAIAGLVTPEDELEPHEEEEEPAELEADEEPVETASGREHESYPEGSR